MTAVLALLLLLAPDASPAELIAQWNGGRNALIESRAKRTDLMDAQAKLQRDLAKARNASKRNDIRTRMEALKEQIATVDAVLTRAEVERAGILNRIAKIKSAEDGTWLATKGLAQAKDPALRRAIAGAIVRAKGVGPDALIKALASARKPELVVPLLQALGEVGASAEAVPPLSAYLKHKEWTVRVAAAFALAATGQAAGLEPVLVALERAPKKSREQRELAAAMERYTGQKHGAFPDVWRKWYETEKLNIEAGRVPLGKGARGVIKSDQGAFYGIPQVGRIIYVVDISGSMEVAIDNPKWIDGEAVPAADDETSRFDAAMKELVRAMRKLHPKTTFAVVLYSSDVKPLTMAMLKANKGNRAAIEKEIAHQGAGGSTNIYAALEFAMRLAGVHPDLKKQKQVADAIYLLSDGAPTTSAGKTEDPERTLLAVREWNALGKVAIHTIGIGKQHSRGFLETLAKQNGGKYYAR